MLSTIIDLISALGAVAAVIVGIITYTKDIRRKKKQDTLEAYSRLQREVIFDIVTMEKKDIQEACKHKVSAEYKKLTQQLIEIEMFCSGLENNIYDFDVFFDTAQDYFDNPKSVLRPRLEIVLATKDERYQKNLYAVWDKMAKKKAGAKR